MTQEVFLRVFRSLNSFRAGDGSFMIWLGRLARNLLVDHYRRSKIYRATESIEEQLPVIEETQSMSAWTDCTLAGREASETLTARSRSCRRRCAKPCSYASIEELEYREMSRRSMCGGAR